MSSMVAGRMPTDRSGNPLPYASKIMTQDGAATPIVSPKTGITTAQVFTPPVGAVAMIFQASAACRYGDNATLDGSTVFKGYKKGGALTDTSISCVAGQNIYIAAESGSIDVDFMFEIVN